MLLSKVEWQQSHSVVLSEMQLSPTENNMSVDSVKHFQFNHGGSFRDKLGAISFMFLAHLT
jgi:hypothetical protein